MQKQEGDNLTTYTVGEDTELKPLIESLTTKTNALEEKLNEGVGAEVRIVTYNDSIGNKMERFLDDNDIEFLSNTLEIYEQGASKFYRFKDKSGKIIRWVNESVDTKVKAEVEEESLLFDVEYRYVSKIQYDFRTTHLIVDDSDKQANLPRITADRKHKTAGSFALYIEENFNVSLFYDVSFNRFSQKQEMFLYLNVSTKNKNYVKKLSRYIVKEAVDTRVYLSATLNIDDVDSPHNKVFFSLEFVDAII